MSDSKETGARSRPSAVVLDPSAGAAIRAVVCQSIRSYNPTQVIEFWLSDFAKRFFSRNIVRPSNESAAGTIYL